VRANRKKVKRKGMKRRRRRARRNPTRARRRRRPAKRRRARSRRRRNPNGLTSLPFIGPLFKAGTLQMVFGVSVGGAAATLGGALLHNFVAKQLPGNAIAAPNMKPLYTVLTGLIGATLLGAMKQKKMAGYVLIGGGVAAATELINKYVVTKLPGAMTMSGYGDYVQLPYSGMGDYVQLPYSGYGSPAQVAAGDFGSVAQVEAGSFGSSFNPSF
jgi:hypothetical protein